MKIKAVLFGVTVIILLAGCSTMPLKPATAPRGDYGYTRGYITWLIQQEMEKQQVTGLSIALVDDQKVVWAEGFGYADKAKGVAASADTVYRAGSISKLLTATAAMQLVDDGLLDIDRPLQLYLPAFAIKSRFPGAAAVTPRTLMTHHSGLPGDLLKGMWTTSPTSLAEEMLLLKDEYAANPPGFVFAYSNVGMALLGHALEKIVDRDFAAQMSIALFLPLRMANSSFSSRSDRSLLASKAYRNNEEVVETPLRDIPAGGLNSSVTELSHFVSMVFADGWFKERQILKAATLAEMLRPQNTSVPLDLSFRVGLGWMLGATGGIDIKNAGPVAHHGGATLYHRSQLIILPEQKLGVVVLANSASAASVVNKVATETLKLALEAKSGIIQPPQQQAAAKPAKKAADSDTTANAPKPGAKSRPAAAERKPLTEAELQAFAGRYDTIVGLVTVKTKADYLEAELSSGTVRLTPRSDGLLGMSYRLLGLFKVSLGELDHVQIDRETINGRDVLKAVIDNREYLAGERLQPVPVPQRWQQRTGEYEIVNSGDDAILVENIRLRYAEDTLAVEYTTPLFTDQAMSVALAPLSDTEAVICGLGRGKGETIRVITRKGEELLAYSGYLLRKKRQ